MRYSLRGSMLVVSGFVAGVAVAFVGSSFAASEGGAKGVSGHTYGVSIDEIKQNFVFADEFVDSYAHTVTLSDGTKRSIALQPVIKDGRDVLELTDSTDGGVNHSYMGPNGTTTNGTLMVSVKDLTAMKAAFH